MDDGTRRIDEDRDWVRVEIEMALRLGIPVIPVLVERARMPRPSEVPEEIRDVTELNALSVEPGPDFQNQINRLTEWIDRIPGNSPPQTKFAAFFAFGKLKIAISIATACLAFVVVYAGWDNVNFQVRTATRDRDPALENLLINPGSRTPEMIVELQRALCVPDSALGNVNAITLELIKIYMDTDGASRSKTQADGRLTDRDVQKLLAAGPCPRDKSRNYFERENFPKTIADLPLLGS